MELIQEARLLDTYPLKRYRWDNGLEALLVHNPISPVAAYLTHYTVGSAQEDDHQRGLAHFFEHMMFRETRTLKDGDFDRIMAECGGVGLNAFTSYDTTAYHVNVPVQQLERVAALEADRMVHLQLSPELIEKERGAVLGEMHMYQDMPSEQLWNTLMEAAFTRHPYRHPIIGYTDQVAGFRQEDFETFYGDHYAPNRAMVVVAGGFDEGDVLGLLDRYYGELPPGRQRPGPAGEEPPPRADRRRDIAHDKISAEFLAMAMRTPGLSHPDVPALQLLAALLATGHSSPLYRRLVLEGLANQVSVSLLDVDSMLASPGLFLVEAALQHGHRAEEAERAVQEVLDGFRQEGIPHGEFERARNQFRLSHYTALRNNMSLARYVGGFTVACGDPLFGERLVGALERLGPEDVQRVLEEYVLGVPRVVVTQRPRSDGAA